MSQTHRPLVCIGSGSALVIGDLIRSAASSVVLVVVALWPLLAQEAIAAETTNVLVLYSNNRLVPGNVAVDRGLRAVLASSSDRTVRTFAEFLDRPEFSGEAYERTMTTYLREKYATLPLDAIVAVSDEAFDFILRHRAALFPGVPLVYTVVSTTLLQASQPLPADVVGVPVRYDYSGTIAQALRWHPAARRLVLVTGASERDREREARLRQEVPRIAATVRVEYLAALPTPLLLRQLGALGPDTVVFTPGYFQDGAGQLFNPHDSAALMAAASTAPMYGPVDTFIGLGVVGGRMPSFEGMGRQAAQIINAILSGAAPASLHLPQKTPTALEVDWRQVERWGIDEKQIPADAVIFFREPTLWEAYRNVVLAMVAVIVVLTALVVSLLVERRRRQGAELVVQGQRTELAHAARLAIAGELTASIAHEINQPLGAILTNADAADLLLQSGVDRRDELRHILADIRRDDLRASDVIRRLRTLLANHEFERASFDLNGALSEVETLLLAEARRRQVTIDFRPASQAALVVGDAIQIQQVLINLVLNAMDAIADVAIDRRVVAVWIKRTANGIAVAVHDHGHGIAPEHLPKLFDSFFSTKHRGMGLGLSIARTIVETHGGRIWAENGQDDGATFHVEFYNRHGMGMPFAGQA